MSLPPHPAPSLRFAPSPTGHFHVGNLRTAWIANRLADLLGLELIVRFEDIDRIRVVEGAWERQQEEMRTLGVIAHRTVHQSQSHERHEAVFRRAIQAGVIYPCFCSRKEVQQDLASMASAPHGPSAVYSGRCRAGFEAKPGPGETIAWRWRAADPGGSADFIVARSEDIDGRGFSPGYHWACAIDDYDGAHALLVRAWDLEGAIPQQRAIHSWLCGLEGEVAVPAVFHTSLVTDDQGHRLEKRTRGVTLPEILTVLGDARTVIRLFERSFETSKLDRERILAPGAVSGEPLRCLTLSQLGVSI